MTRLVGRNGSWAKWLLGEVTRKLTISKNHVSYRDDKENRVNIFFLLIQAKEKALNVVPSPLTFCTVLPGPGVGKDGLDVIFKVKEGRRYSASAHTAIGNNEGSLVLGGKVGNVFGRAERLSLEYSRGSRQSTGYNLTFSKPIFNELSKRLTVQGFKSSGEYLLSSFREIGRGAYVDYTVSNIQET
ncbi:putative sorting and assembly machinery component 50-like B [Apostichopus japonicus]|uniref:Putative sorting and assembly machinery component 50-like B n=1 Tax=Stichopus japonicus TaxID=307972 RepID=A0A2G8JLG2_STIJA|nr:putative sorting and assembly machinery component 50-like B [Apostichopus japonicus]